MRLRIATFNLENLGGGGSPPVAERIAVLRPQLLRLRADILCLQELNADGPKKRHRDLGALDELLAGTGYEGFHRFVSCSSGGDYPYDRHNLAILSRLPFAATAQLRHDLVDPPRHRLVTAVPREEVPAAVEWDRPVLHASFDLGGRRLEVLNVHFRAPLAAAVAGGKSGPFAWRSASAWAEGFFLSAVKRAGQALETRLLVDRLFDADPQALVAVCGDFNAETRETAVRIVAAGEGDTGAGALAGRVLVALDRGAASEYTVVHYGRRAMFDHVLVSRPLLGFVRGAEVHNEGLGDEVGFPEVQAPPDSFHAPVVAEFELPEAGL